MKMNVPEFDKIAREVFAPAYVALGRNKSGTSPVLYMGYASMPGPEAAILVLPWRR